MTVGLNAVETEHAATQGGIIELVRPAVAIALNPQTLA